MTVLLSTTTADMGWGSWVCRLQLYLLVLYVCQHDASAEQQGYQGLYEGRMQVPASLPLTDLLHAFALHAARMADTSLTMVELQLGALITGTSEGAHGSLVLVMHAYQLMCCD